ncbi:MAG: cytochrome C biogenesis protein, partial [Sphingobacteriaceae bacterium]
LIWKAKSWENPVMTVVALSQAFIASMLIGVELFNTRVGSSPFILLRQAIEAPIFARADYLNYVKDGNGLNPLLQNYWMVIHPPTLFLGFASMVVPFAYAIAGLWQRRYKEWIQPAISYSLFAVMILGTGIIMGSFWAYESLNFGGFWAWDPVENASIIPWLTLIAGVHVLIVFKNTGHSYFTAAFLIIISFILVLYASFLTRSGILGNTSVHAFTDLGMSWQLLVYLFVFIAISVWLLVSRWKELPITKKDEETYSREFWMFVGAIFLSLSCLQLIIVTSIPVWNAIFGTKTAPPAEPVRLYNIVQSAFAVVITLLIGFSQFLKYKRSDATTFLIRSVVYLLFAALISALIIWSSGLYHTQTVYMLVIFGSVYAVLANTKYLADLFKGKTKLVGSAVAHIGFALLLVGAVIASGTSKVITINNSGVGFGEDFEKVGNSRENLRLDFNTPVKVGPYLTTYVGDSLNGPNHYFKVNYKRIDEKSGKVSENFTLLPNAQANRKMGLVSSPDTKHYVFKDMYSYVSIAWPMKFQDDQTEESEGHAENNDDKEYAKPVAHEMKIGDTIRYRAGLIILKGIEKDAKVRDIPMAKNDVSVGAQLEVQSNGKVFTTEPIFMIKGGSRFDFSKKVDSADLKVRFSNILPEKGMMEITTYVKPEGEKPYIVMKAIEFPSINFFWSGTIIMVIGFVLSIFRRNKELKTV